MDGLTGFILGGLLGAGVMAALTAASIAEESFQQFKRGYDLGLEDGKKMKGEKRNDK